MSGPPPEVRALAPLWSLVSGIAAGAAAATAVPWSVPAVVPPILLAVGAAAALAALRPRRFWLAWLLAGLALSGGRGLQAQQRHLQLERLMATPPDGTAARARLQVLEGWVPTRWGWRTRVSVDHAHRQSVDVPLPRLCRLEVRGSVRPEALPAAGSSLESLVWVRGEARNPLLVASTTALLEVAGAPRGLPALRDRLARRLLAAAGTDVDRIRAGELAAGLALGRRDLLPEGRREGWRRSGLAHLLAVSGLHVGLVAGMVWIAAVAGGARARTARIAVLVALPSYALLAGASPSAVRAAIMGMVYLGARLLGRALIPMAAVLLAGGALLLARPALIVDAGFQLTVIVTAALVRWVPALVDRAPGPRWLSGALAVPVVAQCAAAPIVAWHFRSAIPGAVAANLLVPALLAPTLAAALAATATAPAWPAAAGWCLDTVAALERLVWIAGGVGRTAELVLPTLPAIAIAALVGAGWLALQPGRRARLGLAGWCGVLVLTGVWWWVRPAPPPHLVQLLPVTDGLAAGIRTAAGTILVDGGRRTEDAARLLADLGHRPVTAVVASHSDEDHVGGLPTVIANTRPGVLLLPRWMASEPLAVPLVRSARRVGAAVLPVARGSVLRIGGSVVEVLWPPSADPPALENERSLVARVVLGPGSVLITSDIGHTAEQRLVHGSMLAGAVLIAPHHGSRQSTSALLLEATTPEVVLIPAGPGNVHNHPHHEVLARIEARGVPVRFPARDGTCGAVYRDGEWVAFP